MDPTWIIAILCFCLLYWLIARPPKSELERKIADLELANASFKLDLDAFMNHFEQTASGDSKHYEAPCKRVIAELRAWDHPSTQEIKNWLVSQGFWRVEIAGIPVYTNGQHTWYAKAAPPKGEYAVATDAVYNLKQTGKRSQLAVWLYSDTTDCIKNMTRTMERAARS